MGAKNCDADGTVLSAPAPQRVGHAARTVTLERAVQSSLGKPSVRTAEIGLRFGIPSFEARSVVLKDFRVELRPGTIMLINGPSGSGKTLALGQIARQWAGGCNIERIQFPHDVAVVDRIATGSPLDEALRTLTACGLGEPRLWVRRFAELSEGEKFRARLARAVAQHSRGANAPLLCDEFGSVLHRRMAKVISFNLRKLVTQLGLSVVLATSQDDIIADLQPDVIVRLRDGGQGDVEMRTLMPDRAISFRRRLRIEPGRKADYEAFSAMHYRDSDELGFVDKVFVLREGPGGELLGVVVYAHGPVELAMRNHATAGCFTRNPRRLNREVRILRRMVIHPDVRGCGLGHYLVRRTLPMVGTPYVECLAAMGEFNPVFEKAGMKRVGQYEASPKCLAALEAVASLDVDVMSPRFAIEVSRSPRVRAIVGGVVRDWYSATTGGGDSRVEGQSPEFLAHTFRGLVGLRPVYYLWKRTKAA